LSRLPGIYTGLRSMHDVEFLGFGDWV
jgi:hypothetical protein